MAKFTDFHDYIITEVPVLKAMATAQIKLTCADFCERTNVWRYKPAPIRGRANVYAYQIPQRAGTSICQVIELKDEANGIEYHPVASEEEAHGFCFVHPEPDELKLFPAPEAGAIIQPTVSLKPQLRQDVTDVDDVLLERWADAIIHGTLYRLKSMPGKEWTDMSTAKGHHEREYEKAVSRAMKVHLHGYSNAPKYIKAPAFGG